MPNKLRIITDLATKPTKKPFFLLNHVKEVNEIYLMERRDAILNIN